MILQIVARLGALCLSRSARHEELLCDVVGAAQGGGLPVVGYAVVHAGSVVWAVECHAGLYRVSPPCRWSHGGTWCPFRRRLF